MRHARQRGVALLVAIVIFAMATTVAAAITYNKAMASRRAAATYTMELALQAGMAAEALAALALENDAGKPTTDLKQDWALDQPPFELQDTGIWIQGKVEDLSGRFNLNSVVKFDPSTSTFVVDPEQQQVFRNLLGYLDIDTRYADLLADSWALLRSTGERLEDLLVETQRTRERVDLVLLERLGRPERLPARGPHEQPVHL